jgi:hypothetical protein
MLTLERRFALNLKWFEWSTTWLGLCFWCCYVITFIFTSFIHVHKSSCYPWCIHEIHWVHIHAIGVLRIVTTVKLCKAWIPKLESVREPEVLSDEAGEDVGTVLEAKPWSIFFWLRQTLEHYKPPTFKAIIYIYTYYICIIALRYRSWLETLAALITLLVQQIEPWILYRQDHIYA